VKQESLLYFPTIGGMGRHNASNPKGYRSPSDYNIPYETHMIQCQDGVTIHSWLLLYPGTTTTTARSAREHGGEKNDTNEKIPTIIFFHGNAGNIGLRLPNANEMYHNLRCNIFMVEYRGYGDSDDVKPTEAGLKLDAEASLLFLLQHPKIDSDRIFVFGRSLGGAVAFHLAKFAQDRYLQQHQQQHPKQQIQYLNPSQSLLAGIIVENTFLSISKMVDSLMPLIAPLKPLVLRIGWNSDRIAHQIRAPILYLAGASDELVPHSHMKELYRLSNISSVHPRIHIVKYGTHNDTWLRGGRDYFMKTRQFLSHVLLRNTHTPIMDVMTPPPTTSTTSSSIDNAPRARTRTTSMETTPTTINRVRTFTETSTGSIPSSSIEVNMGGTTSSDASYDMDRNSIPIMPSNLVAMTKAATMSSVSKKSDKKKEK